MIKVRRALISVSDKSGLIDLARVLAKHDVEMVSTGGTAKALRDAGFPVKEISQLTGFPEILDGRVKTLHPIIYGGILYRRDVPEHVSQIEKHGIKPIDLVVVNLYPFEKMFWKKEATDEEMIENIDIGGPSMIRASSKNWEHVVVVIDPRFYPAIIKEMENNNGSVSENTARRMAGEVFRYTSYYDWLISCYFAKGQQFSFDDTVGFYFKKVEDLRYGENPHQKAAWYRSAHAAADFEQLQGKQLSFNNILDLESAYRIVCECENPACCIIKHNNPCGAALGENISQAYQRALETDPLSAFGGIIGFNREVDSDVAALIVKSFYEVVVAPSFTADAVSIFSAKENLRLIRMHRVLRPEFETKGLASGILIQTPDEATEENYQVVTKKKPTDEEMEAMKFANVICKFVKSNAIVFGTTGQICGIGAGQMSRFDSTRIAVMKMKDNFKRKISPLVMASDAFFPFPDSVEIAAKAGITAIVQPGGSIKDKEVISVCDKLGIAMVTTGVRHFRH